MKSCPACGLSYPDETTFCFLDGQTCHANEDELLGTTVDGLVRLETLLAHGGWSRTYLGRFRLIAMACVVKLLEVPDGTDELSEILAMARRSSHANVLPTFATRIVGKRVMVVRQAVDAHPLALLIERAQLDVSQAMGLTLQVLSGLARIHDFGAIHGNLRPSNALYWSNGHLDLIDVGLGRTVARAPWEDQPDSLMAQHYAAPELSHHQRSSVQADLFAAGVIAFELLTRRRPFPGEDVRAIREKLNDESTAALAAALAPFPRPIANWTLGMLSLAPDKRPENGQHALELLRAACQDAAIAPMLDPGRPAMPSSMGLDSGLLRWERYRSIFARMLEGVLLSGPAAQVQAGFGAIGERVDRLAVLGKRATIELGKHEVTFARALSGRQRLAAQIAVTRAGVEDIRKRIVELLAAEAASAEVAGAFQPTVMQCHREVMTWEGRSGFSEPYRELATAYRQLADVMGAWWEARQTQLGRVRDIEVEREKLRAIDSEVEDIRQALRIHESNVHGELESAEAALEELGREADVIEFELLDLASRFTAPLRSRPELGPQFRELTARV